VLGIEFPAIILGGGEEYINTSLRKVTETDILGAKLICNLFCNLVNFRNTRRHHKRLQQSFARLQCNAFYYNTNASIALSSALVPFSVS
jgi:hypothetical protein